MEAMACGVAVVGSTSAEIPNVIGDAGLVVPEGDAAALREAIARLLADRQLREEFGRRGRRRVHPLACNNPRPLRGRSGSARLGDLQRHRVAQRRPRLVTVPPHQLGQLIEDEPT
jgi:hypothetical protein